MPADIIAKIEQALSQCCGEEADRAVVSQLNTAEVQQLVNDKFDLGDPDFGDENYEKDVYYRHRCLVYKVSGVSSMDTKMASDIMQSLFEDLGCLDVVQPLEDHYKLC